ncbi:MAG: hypothetical protein JWP61_655 [Friedmanniella sp.]|jgi:hypothetical protein|nr:hypothetical protein [Friedmanniella sp.]
MKWSVMVVIGAAVGGVFWAAYRRTQEESDAARRWAASTDSVAGFDPV